MNLLHFLIWLWGITLALILIGFVIGALSARNTHISPLIERESYMAKRGCLVSAFFLRIGFVVTVAALVVRFVIKYLL